MTSQALRDPESQILVDAYLCDPDRLKNMKEGVAAFAQKRRPVWKNR